MQHKATYIGLWTIAACLGCIGPAYAGISNVTPTEGTVGTEITLTGSGFGDKQGKVELGGEACQVLAWARTQIQCLVTHAQPAGVYTIAVSLPKDPNQSALMTFAGFSMMTPEIAAETTPRLVSAGEAVTVAGAFFGDKEGKVWLEDTNGEATLVKVLDWSMDSISFEIPGGLTGIWSLGVLNEVGLGFQNSWCTFEPLPPGVHLGQFDYPAPGEVCENATGLNYNGHFWVFWPCWMEHVLGGIWFYEDSFQPPYWYWRYPPTPSGHSKAQLAPLVIENVLWLFHTALDGAICYERYDTTAQTWESRLKGGSYHEIPGVSTSSDCAVAPVYNPLTHRLDVYFHYGGLLYWVRSDDYGTNWSSPHWVYYAGPISGAPSAVFTPEKLWFGDRGFCDTCVAVRTRYTGGDYLSVLHIKDGYAMGDLGGYGSVHLPEGRPFLTDLSTYALLWKSPDTGCPMISYMDKTTGRWGSPRQVNSRPTLWSPTAAVHYYTDPLDFYYFWGYRNIVAEKWWAMSEYWGY